MNSPRLRKKHLEEGGNDKLAMEVCLHYIVNDLQFFAITS